MPKGVEKVSVILDLEKIVSFPTLSNIQDLIDILRDHYPERLFKVYILNAGDWLTQIVNLAGFLPTETREKLRFVTDNMEENDSLVLAMQSYGGAVSLDTDIPKESLLREYGGNFEFEWDLEYYWKIISIL
ncbi:hypothetical protein HK103_000657 [Boothiomyces macroporosus]|uniref:CRAL-TRIO domain-containing protein n=1 Tax=Boothiomyces macroporosus TaxID=261099 RepID=A0AAD5UKF8_9FUNG|nr:hypothetical protein HK103_000657 [Boothiomyces macroporosus]